VIPVSTMSSISSTSLPSSGTAVEYTISVWTRPAACSRLEVTRTRWMVRSSGILRIRSHMKTRLPFIRPSTVISRPDRLSVIWAPSSETRLAICSSVKRTEMSSFMTGVPTMIRLSPSDWGAFRDGAHGA
jgi:hypothetical protein